MLLWHYIDATISFEHEIYSIDENDGLVQPVLVLSNPSSFVINVQVRNNDKIAIG